MHLAKRNRLTRQSLIDHGDFRIEGSDGRLIQKMSRRDPGKRVSKVRDRTRRARRHKEL
jgi:hypothetical protein